MPNRMLRDWTGSDKIKLLTVHAERFFVRLIMKADDYGYFHANISLLKAYLFPLLLDGVREADISRWMTECQMAGLILLYEAEGKRYLQILDFRQRLDKAKAKFPLPDSTVFPEVVNGFPAELEVESELEKETNTGAATPPTATKNLKIDAEKKKFVAPQLQQVTQYFLSTIGDATKEKSWPEDKCRFEAGEFMDHYIANGWVQGRGKPIKDWQAACRNWIRNGIKGTFEKSAPVKKEIPLQHIKPAEPKLTQMEVEINYLYGMFLEDKCTAMSIYPEQYDHLKKWDRIRFNDEQVKTVRTLAEKSIEEQQIPSSEKLILQVMKKHGVIEFFKQLKLQAKETVFDVDRKTTTAA